MIKFHPDQNILIEYASGALDTAVAIGVKTHISFCPKCRNEVNRLRQLGGAYLEEQKAPESSDIHDEKANFASLMEKIKLHESAVGRHIEPVQESAQHSGDYHVEHLPKIVQKLIHSQVGVDWKSVSPSLKQARLKTGQSKYEVCLHKIRKGGAVAKHDHKGLEVTVVLEGAFSDEKGTYRKGDFVLREPGELHRPTATRDQDCLCLSMVSAPVKLSGLLGTVLNPFLRISPS